VIHRLVTGRVARGRRHLKFARLGSLTGRAQYRGLKTEYAHSMAITWFVDRINANAKTQATAPCARSGVSQFTPLRPYSAEFRPPTPRSELFSLAPKESLMATKPKTEKTPPAPMKPAPHIREKIAQFRALIAQAAALVTDPAIDGNDRLCLLTAASRELSAPQQWDGSTYTAADRPPLVKQITLARTAAIVESIERLGGAAAVAAVIGTTSMAVHQVMVRHAGKPVTKKPKPTAPAEVQRGEQGRQDPAEIWLPHDWGDTGEADTVRDLPISRPEQYPPAAAA
jgi:hypothetical protein